MAVRVPNTNTFSLMDVWNAVKDHALSTTGDLQDCFVNSISSYFDPTYNDNSYAVANSMKRFRNYGPPVGCLIDNVSYVREQSVSSQDLLPFGVFFKPDGTRMYVVGDNSNAIYEYSLSTAWNLSTASLAGSVSLSPAIYRGIYINPDGTRMYLVNQGAGRIESYSLSTAWDISTASLLTSYLVSPQTDTAYGIWFSDDGTKMFVTGWDGSNTVKVCKYTLSSAWDLGGTVTYNQTGTDTSVVVWGDLVLNSSGTKLWVILSVSHVWQFDLSTAWDLSTMTYVCAYNHGILNTFGLFISSDINRMYITSTNTDTVRQYDLN